MDVNMPTDQDMRKTLACIKQKDFTYEQIEAAMNDHYTKRRNYFADLNIPNVDENVFKDFALYAATNGYTVEDFSELIEEKIFYKFAAVLKEINPQEYDKYYD